MDDKARENSYGSLVVELLEYLVETYDWKMQEIHCEESCSTGTLMQYPLTRVTPFIFSQSYT